MYYDIRHAHFGTKSWCGQSCTNCTVCARPVYTYLIDTPGGYTKEKLKAFKSLEAHNYFMRYNFMYIFKAIIYILVIHSGWVQTVYYHDLGYGNKICVLNALVNPSQCLSEKPHEPWIAVDKWSGTVVTAHCTCMAG